MPGIIIISDTHNHLPIQLSSFSEDTIFHAGDICDIRVLNELFLFKNQFVVRGNCDFFDASGLNDTLFTEIDGVRFLMVHNLAAPHRIIYSNQELINKYKPDVVIFGHTHTPLIFEENNILFINPGSFGKPGLTNIYSYAKLIIEDKAPQYAAIYNADTNEVVVEWKR